MKRVIIPYSPHLKLFAKKLRQNMTLSEVKFWNEIKNVKMMGYDFDRQRPIGNYIVDFYCKDLHLVIEIDGITHEEEKSKWKDQLRQNELRQSGVQFLRFDALLILNKAEAAVRELAYWIIQHEEKYGVPVLVKKRWEKMVNPPLPLQGGDAITQPSPDDDSK